MKTNIFLFLKQSIKFSPPHNRADAKIERQLQCEKNEDGRENKNKSIFQIYRMKCNREECIYEDECGMRGKTSDERKRDEKF